jgi:hypothetical protein
LYEDCWNGNWKCNLANPKQWHDILPILSSFFVQKNRTNKSQINILVAYVGRAKVNLDVANALNNL